VIHRVTNICYLFVLNTLMSMIKTIIVSSLSCMQSHIDDSAETFLAPSMHTDAKSPVCAYMSACQPAVETGGIKMPSIYIRV
jgi:hypothetical protein